MGVYFTGRASDPPIRVWREPIDADAVAIIVFAEAVYRGALYRSSFFVIIDMPVYLREWRHSLQYHGEAAFRAIIGKRTRYRNELEFVEYTTAVESI